MADAAMDEDQLELACCPALPRTLVNISPRVVSRPKEAFSRQPRDIPLGCNIS